MNSFNYSFKKKGCLNGGGQLKPKVGENQKDLLKRVEAIYNQQVEKSPLENPIIEKIYKEWVSGIFSPDAKTKLHTQYHAREKILNPLAIKW